jgi:hypothetical protein
VTSWWQHRVEGGLTDDMREKAIWRVGNWSVLLLDHLDPGRGVTRRKLLSCMGRAKS